jgi:hypothetical protein
LAPLCKAAKKLKKKKGKRRRYEREKNKRKDARRRRIWRVVVLGIHAAVNGVCVWVRHNRVRDVGNIFWWNNYVLLGSDRIDRVCCVELSKGKGSALNPESKGAMPP